MNTTIAAAIISGGWAAVVAIVGFGATIRNTTTNIKADHDDRIWNRRAKVYVATIAAVHHRQASRVRDTRDPHAEDEWDRRAARYLAAGPPPDWHILEARLLAFASQPVTTAVQASAIAHERTIDAYDGRQEAATNQAAVNKPGKPLKMPTTPSLS